MTVTLDLPPDLETDLVHKAARAGKPLDQYIVDSLRPKFIERSPHRLSREESELLLKINKGLPSTLWERHHELTAKRREETITSQELLEHKQIIDQVEQYTAQRTQLLLELANLWRVSLSEVMQRLGIPADNG